MCIRFDSEINSHTSTLKLVTTLTVIAIIYFIKHNSLHQSLLQLDSAEHTKRNKYSTRQYNLATP